MSYTNKQAEQNDSSVESKSLFDKIKEKIQMMSNYIDNTHQDPLIVHTPSSETNSILKLDIATQVDTKVITDAHPSTDKIVADIAVSADILNNSSSECADETNHSLAGILSLDIGASVGAEAVVELLNTANNVITNIEVNADILTNSTAEACYPDSEDYPNNNPTTTNSLVDLDVAANVGTGLVTGILHAVDNIAANIEVNAAILADAYSDSCDTEDDSNPYSIGNLLGLSVASNINTNILTDVLHTVDNIAANVEINADILNNNSTSEACYPDSEDYPNNNPTTTNSLVDLDVAANLSTGIVTDILHAVDNIAANVEVNANILTNNNTEICDSDSEDYPNNNPATTNSLVDLDVVANVGTGLVTGILHAVDNIAANIEVNAAILADAYSDSCDTEDNSNPYSIGNLLGLSVASNINTNILTDVLHKVDNIAANVEINADILNNSTSEACYPDSEDYPNNNPTTTNSLVDLDVVANVGTGLVTGILHAVDNIAANVEINADILNNSTSEACYPDSEDYPNNNPTTNSLVDLDVVANVGTGLVTGILHAVDNIAANVEIKADILNNTSEACYPDSEDYPNNNPTTTNSLVDLDVVANVGTGLVTGILHAVDNIAANVEVNANILSSNASEETPSECNETGNTGSLITLLGGFGDDIMTTANKNLEAILKNGTQDIADFIKDVSEVKIPESISVSDLGIDTSVTATLDNTDSNHGIGVGVAAIAVTTAVSLLEDTTESVHTATSAATGFTAPLFESVGLTQAHDAITETLNSIHSGLDSLFGR